MQMQIILLPLDGHAHLAEPDCLCIKQALGANAEQTLGAWLGTRRRTDHLSQPLVWPPEVPPEPGWCMRKICPPEIPGSHLQLGDLVGWCFLTPHGDGERITTTSPLGHVPGLNSQPYGYEPKALPLTLYTSKENVSK